MLCQVSRLNAKPQESIFLLDRVSPNSILDTISRIIKEYLPKGFTGHDLKSKRIIYTLLSCPQDPNLDFQWMEAVDYFYHSFGKMVFDQGLHGFDVEPGFMESWYAAKQFLYEKMNTGFSSSLYLELHKISCRHFNGEKTGTLMGQEKVGVFRTSEDALNWNTQMPFITYQAIEELTQVNEELELRFGVSLAHFEWREELNLFFLKYTPMSRETMTQIFDYFIWNFHNEMALATTSKEKLRAICYLIRNMEWSHSVKDGCGRCDALILNFLLAQYGFVPAIINPHPYICNVVPLDIWVKYVEMGMSIWLNTVFTMPVVF